MQKQRARLGWRRRSRGSSLQPKGDLEESGRARLRAGIPGTWGRVGAPEAFWPVACLGLGKSCLETPRAVCEANRSELLICDRVC